MSPVRAKWRTAPVVKVKALKKLVKFDVATASSKASSNIYFNVTPSRVGRGYQTVRRHFRGDGVLEGKFCWPETFCWRQGNRTDTKCRTLAFMLLYTEAHRAQTVEGVPDRLQAVSVYSGCVTVTRFCSGNKKREHFSLCRRTAHRKALCAPLVPGSGGRSCPGLCTPACRSDRGLGASSLQ